MLRDRREGVTLCLIILCYTLWLVELMLYKEFIGDGAWGVSILILVALAITMAFHSSLQHEVMHGHPFESQVLNDAVVFPAIGLLVPYLRFRDTHMSHHQDAKLTDPYDDPESNYLDTAVWERLPKLLKLMLRANNTLAGRMVFGPAVGMFAFYRSDWREIRKGDSAVIKGWVLHVLGVSMILPILAWAGMSLWIYFLVSYVAMSLLRVRTFLEHQAHEHYLARTVIIEDKGPMALLFLNNNYHCVHHAHPQLAWYDLPAKYREGRDNYLARNRGYLYSSYWEIFRKHMFTPKDDVPHPLYEKDKE